MSDLNPIIGENLKQLRSRRGLTLDQVAELTGVSKSMIGQIERGNSAPTVTTLWKICNGLKVSFSSLMDVREYEPAIVSKDRLSPLVRKNVFRLFNYIPFNMQRKFEAFRMELLPGATHASEAHSDAVEEFVYVTDGEVVIHVADVLHHLQAADLLRFNATLAHAYENPTQLEAGLLVIIVYE
jgi:XRE family transcriptional regulator, regulator of sulfur utilization